MRTKPEHLTASALAGRFSPQILDFPVRERHIS
jgi:hypothetical protein